MASRYTYDLIVIGASQGGVEALSQLVSQLPEDLQACVCVVQHLAASHRSVLPDILSRVGPLPARHPLDGEPLEYGHIYLAPNDRHLLVESGYVRVVKGPLENGHRPAVDSLFRSAARAYGPRVVGVVLTGALNCGTAGLLAIKAQGGLAVVQDPSEATCADMPRSALEYVKVDHVSRLSQLGPLLARLSTQPVRPPRRQPRPGLTQQVQQSVGALWAAARALEENAAVARRLAHRAREANHLHSARRYEERALSAEQQALAVRRLALQGNVPPGLSPSAQEDEPGQAP